MQESKPQYETPTISVVGTVEGVTAGASNGNFLDRTYPINTPKPAITFSH